MRLPLPTREVLHPAMSATTVATETTSARRAGAQLFRAPLLRKYELERRTQRRDLHETPWRVDGDVHRYGCLAA